MLSMHIKETCTLETEWSSNLICNCICYSFFAQKRKSNFFCCFSCFFLEQFSREKLNHLEGEKITIRLLYFLEKYNKQNWTLNMNTVYPITILIRSMLPTDLENTLLYANTWYYVNQKFSNPNNINFCVYDTEFRLSLLKNSFLKAHYHNK